MELTSDLGINSIKARVNLHFQHQSEKNIVFELFEWRWGNIKSVLKVCSISNQVNLMVNILSCSCWPYLYTPQWLKEFNI